MTRVTESSSGPCRIAISNSASLGVDAPWMMCRLSFRSGTLRNSPASVRVQSESRPPGHLPVIDLSADDEAYRYLAGRLKFGPNKFDAFSRGSGYGTRPLAARVFDSWIEQNYLPYKCPNAGNGDERAFRIPLEQLSPLPASRPFNTREDNNWSSMPVLIAETTNQSANQNVNFAQSRTFLPVEVIFDASRVGATWNR